MSDRRAFMKNISAVPALGGPISHVLAAASSSQSAASSAAPSPQALQIVQRGIVSRSQPGTRRAILLFPSVTVLSDGTLLATCRPGSTKDSPDETIELYKSGEGGRTWRQRPFSAPTIVNGKLGSSKLCHITEIEPRHLLAAILWVDRETYPGKPLFRQETEGCLPMSIVLADSHDSGHAWSPWRFVSMPAEIGPASLTNPIMKLPDGTLAMSIETNKNYEDRSKWFQKVGLFHSKDKGRTWGPPVVAGADPTGRIFNWDQRAGVAPDGRLVTFLWTFDSQTNTYLNIHRRISSDGGYTWSPAEDLGFADQPAHPAIFPDGRVVLAFVDRFQSHSLRARWAQDVTAPFPPETEVVIYSHPATGPKGPKTDTTGEALVDMSAWSYGIPYGEALPDGDAIVMYYAGTPTAMDIHWACLRLPRLSQART
jgi:hypothetical protein